MQIFLAAIPLIETSVIVVGAGEPALAKLRLFIPTPTRLLWFVPEGLPEAAGVPRGAPDAMPRSPDDADMKGAKLVFIALDDEDLAGTIAASARAGGAWVNVVDRPAISDFQTPALIDRDAVVIGIATGGKAPILARDVRSRVEGVLPVALGPMAEIAGRLRDRAKAVMPDVAVRRRFWERVFRGPAMDMATAGRLDDATAEMERLLDVEQADTGMVHIVGVGPGDPEFLTLKTLRILQDADLLVHDDTVPEAILIRARRDAFRFNIEDGTAPNRIETMMRDAALEGQRVARLHAGDPRSSDRAKAEHEALAAAGVAVFMVPGVA